MTLSPKLLAKLVPDMSAFASISPVMSAFAGLTPDFSSMCRMFVLPILPPPVHIEFPPPRPKEITIRIVVGS